MRWADPGTNACCANACVSAPAWCVKDLRWVSGTECWLQQLLTDVRQLSMRGPYSIIECPVLQPALKRWHQTHPMVHSKMQLSSLPLCVMDSGVAQGGGVCQQSEAACDWSSVLDIDVPVHHWTGQLQELVHEWHQQEMRMQALTMQAPFLCQQLRSSWPQARASWAFRVMTPHLEGHTCTEVDLQVTWIRYQVQAVVCHHGLSYRAGHYTAGLIPQFPHVICKDDDRTPFVRSLADVLDLDDRHRSG